METIKLNFAALADQFQPINLYRSVVEDGSAKKGDSDYRCKLPKDGDENCDWLLYDISWMPKSGYEEFSISYSGNPHLSEHYLFERLKNELSKNWDGCTYEFPEDTKYKEVRFVVDCYPEGNTEVVLYPYYLKSKKKLGFLLEHHFRLNDGVESNRKTQILSFSLDKSGRPNVFIYRDKQSVILKFISQYFKSFSARASVEIDDHFIDIQAKELSRKSYKVGNGQFSQSQFIGVKNSGPYRTIKDDVRYSFLFSERTRPIARDVYLGLTGKLFPSQFPGLSGMFSLHIDKELVNHHVIESFDQGSLDRFGSELDKLKSHHPDSKIMLVAILPKDSNDSEGDFDAYIYLKYIALKHDVYCQVVKEDTTLKKDQLMWSIANIGLQIFGKLGGTPWLVKPAKNDCLILGLGSAHEKHDDGTTKYVAYTVCLDSSGDFKYIKPLSVSDKEDGYLKDFQNSLDQTLRQELNVFPYKSCVLHLPFKIKKKEIEAIKNVIHRIKEDDLCELIVLKINTRHRFLGFGTHNTRVPYESSLIELSNNQFLLWAEGLQYGKEVLHRRVSEPLHIEFLEPPDSWESKLDCLQDVLNLTGTNWRGFNSKAQPISILYSELIARFMKEFSHLDGCNDFSILRAESVAPWFL